MMPVLISDLKAFAEDPKPQELGMLAALNQENCFTLFLIDGLSMLEEPVIARIAHAIKGIPLIGASAGDGLDFGHTYVYHDGAFHENIAVLAVFDTSLPFVPLHIQHFVPTGERLVITEADIATRTVKEINGMPAVEEYAAAVGMTIDKLTPLVFAAHPVMLKIGGEYYVRSILKVNPDGSLTFFCAIDTGLVLTVAKHSTTLIENLEAGLAEVRKTIFHPALIFASDCILRRLEMKQYGELDKVKSVLAQYPLIGFSTYGEQFGAVHGNHTLTVLALGEASP